MNDFVYHIPTKMYFGKECLNKLAAEMKSSGKKVLIVYGGGSVVRSGLLDRLRGYLKDDFEIYEHSGIEPNPKIGSIRRAADTCKEKGIDMILAVGGGSVIDASKAIAAGACVDFDPWDFFGGPRKPIEKALPLYTVVTMASTGSEMTCGAVIGYYGGVVTGYYSFETFVAVKNFQTDSGLRADGVAGQQTLTALYK